MLYPFVWIGSIAPWPWTAVLVSLAAGAVVLGLALKSAPRAEPPPQTPGAIQAVLGSDVPESSGVRWEIAAYPGTLSVPGYAVLTAILQNATDRPRAVTLEIAAGSLLPRGFSCTAALKPGEAGILRAPLFIPQAAEIGQHTLSAKLMVRAPEGEGRRLLPGPRRRDSGSRTASLQVVSSHSQPPVNLFVFDWQGFRSLYIPPQTAPDLTELRIVQELPSYPQEG